MSIIYLNKSSPNTIIPLKTGESKMFQNKSLKKKRQYHLIPLPLGWDGLENNR